ncbi:MAG: prepilin peptidase [Holosporaceae bacterium]|nr:prepilin peptidase [Holosporaceae bacterium]
MFAITLVIVSLNDFLFFRIENEVVLFLLGLYAISFVLGVSGSNFVLGASMAVAVFAITYVMNRKNLIGGGDVKLLFPLLLFAESDMNEFVLGMSVSGVLLCVVYMLFAKKIFLFRKKIITQLQIFYQKKNRSLFFKFRFKSRLERRFS